jgi:hypothetical protein
MTTYAGGTLVKSGYYIDTASFTFANIEKDGGKLPGSAGTSYMRVPVMLVLAAAPVLGGLFVVALPFIGFGLTAYAIGRKIGGHAKEGAKEIAATMSPGLVPGEAHLTGKPSETAGAEAAEADAEVEALAKEIEEKRSPKS